MIIKLNDIVANIENLKEIQQVKLPIKVSYKIMRFVNKLDPILKAYDEKRNELVKEYGEEQEDKSIRVTDPEKLQLFTKELTKLLETEETIDFEPINSDLLDNINIEPKLLLSFLFA